MKRQKVVDQALALAKRGWQVLPVAPNGKVPLTLHGLKDASRDEETIKEWARAWPKMNLGVRTGAESGLIVLDVDPKPSLGAALKRLKDAGFKVPKTLKVQTGSGGLHFYFRHPGKPIKTMAGILGPGSGIDVRGEGGYVVAPGSTHESGQLYKVLRDGKLAKCPKWLLKATTAAPKPAASATQSGVVVAEGGRDQYLTQLAGALRRKGASFEALLAAVEAENGARCSPPLSSRQCFKIAKSVERYQPEDVSSAAVEISADSYVQASELTGAMEEFLANKNKKLGVSTGIGFLDRALGGGRRLGEITVLTAIAKAGKSSWLAQQIYELLRLGEKVGFASREMSPAEEVLPNILSIASDQNVWLDGLNKAARGFDLSGLFFSKGYGYFSSDEFKSWALSLKEQHGVRFLILDHFHYALQDPEDFQAASRFVRDLKAFCKEHEMHLDLVVQPTKLQPGDRVSVNTLRGGAAIAQAADNIFTLERVPDTKNITRICLEVGRSKLCEVGTVGYFAYDKQTTRFEEVEPDISEDDDED